MMHLSKDGGNPYLVRFRESFVVSASGELCIVMDFCNGGDLACAISAQRARGGAFDEERVLLWLLQTLSAMDFLHCHNVLHRDIKVRMIKLSTHISHVCTHCYRARLASRRMFSCIGACASLVTWDCPSW